MAHLDAGSMPALANRAGRRQVQASRRSAAAAAMLKVAGVGRPLGAKLADRADFDAGYEATRPTPAAVLSPEGADLQRRSMKFLLEELSDPAQPIFGVRCSDQLVVVGCHDY